MKILIVKHGALGDVVRTSYFAEPLRRKYGKLLELVWITAPNAAPLLAHNPHIDRIVTGFDPISKMEFDLVYSLDDEEDFLDEVARLRAERIVGAYRKDGRIAYSDDSSAWFDMGLRSRFGKIRADELKRLNKRGHAEIFADVFEIPGVQPSFYGDPALEAFFNAWRGDWSFVIGINPFAGGRWPSKELQPLELSSLIRALLEPNSLLPATGGIVLTGAGSDRLKNVALCDEICDSRVRVADTEKSPLHLAALIRQLDCLVSSDSLAMHLAIAQGVATVAFFCPTSAAEIDGFDRVIKVTSTARDYCSYRRDADNTTITNARLLEGIVQLSQLSQPKKRGRFVD